MVLVNVYLLPAMSDRRQQILDENHILFLTEVFEMSSSFVQTDHDFSVR